jgi:hypothetical protein
MGSDELAYVSCYVGELFVLHFSSVECTSDYNA